MPDKITSCSRGLRVDRQMPSQSQSGFVVLIRAVRAEQARALQGRALLRAEEEEEEAQRKQQAGMPRARDGVLNSGLWAQEADAVLALGESTVWLQQAALSSLVRI